MNVHTHPSSRALTVLLLACIAAAPTTGCFIEEKQQQKQIKPQPDAKKTEADRKIRDQKINAEKQTLSYWMRANSQYPIVPSVAAVVVEGNEVVFRDTVRCEPVTPFLAASLTKTFTAISILQLADRNIISLNDRISKYLNVDFENKELKSKPITIWHLLTHTSGLIEDPNPKYEQNNFPFTVPEQKYPTGYRFNYCNQGYNLLGFIVFEASGLPLGEYVTRNILVPMEMKDSKAPITTRGAAGIECSVNDLAKYMIMFLHGGVYKGKRIISKRMFSKIIDETIESPRSRKKEYRGLCFRIWSVDGKIYSMHHAAHMPGAGGFMQLFPRDNCGYVFISNPPVYDREEYYAYYYGLKSRLVSFCRVLMGDSFDPVNFDPDKPTVKQLQLFEGRYRNYINPDNGQYIDIELHPGGYLIAKKSYTGQQYGIVPTSLHTFVYIYPGQNEKGEIYDFVMRQGKVIGLGVKEGYFVK
jgi:CubicO group peptidase (beta-lactamase class C family)